MGNRYRNYRLAIQNPILAHDTPDISVSPSLDRPLSGNIPHDEVLRAIPRWSNSVDIRALNPVFAERLALTLEYMKTVRGWGTEQLPGMIPVVSPAAVRSASEEHALTKQGVAWTNGASMHIPGKEGSGAVDITLRGADKDFDKSKVGQKFYKELSEAATLFGLESGWEWQTAPKDGIVKDGLGRTVTDAQGKPVIDLKKKEIWDPGHIQIPERQNTGHRTNVPTASWIQPIESDRIGPDVLNKLYSSLWPDHPILSTDQGDKAKVAEGHASPSSVKLAERKPVDAPKMTP